MLDGVEDGDFESVGLAKFQALVQFFLTAEFGDVNEPGNTLFNTGQSAMFVEFDNDASHHIIFFVFLSRFGPMIFF